MKTFKVTVACTVEAYGTTEIKAKSQAEAEAIVRKNIELNEWTSLVWQKTTIKPDWSGAFDLRVV